MTNEWGKFKLCDLSYSICRWRKYSYARPPLQISTDRLFAGEGTAGWLDGGPTAVKRVAWAKAGLLGESMLRANSRSPHRGLNWRPVENAPIWRMRTKWGWQTGNGDGMVAEECSQWAIDIIASARSLFASDKSAVVGNLVNKLSYLGIFVKISFLIVSKQL